MADTEDLIPGWVENRSELTSFLLSLKRTWPEASALFESLGWVRDGIGNPSSGLGLLEVDVVSNLRDYWILGPTGQELVLSLLSKPWMQDNVSFEEAGVVTYLGDVLRKNSVAASLLLQMPFLDSVDGDYEPRMIDMIDSIMFSDTSAFQRLLSRPEFVGGITDDHAAEIALIRFERSEPESGAAIRALQWVQDGTSVSDYEEVIALIDLARRSDVFFRAAMTSLGLQDGISEHELTPLQSLSYARRQLVWNHPDAVNAIEALPWLLDGVNRTEWDGALALMNLGREDITAFWSTIESDWVQDGITEDEVGMISSLAQR